MPGDALLLFLSCLALLLFLTFFSRNIISPGALYFFVIAGTLAIAFLQLHPAMTPLQPMTWLLIGGSSFAFLSGSWIARFYFWAKGITIADVPIARNVAKDVYENYLWGRHLRWTFLFLFLYAIAAVRFLFHYGAPTLLADEYLEIVGQTGMQIGYFGFVLMLYPLGLMLLYPALGKDTGYQPWIRVLLRVVFILFFVIGFLFWPVRGALMHIVVYMVMFVNMFRNRLKLVHLSFLGILAIALFMMVSSMKDQIGKFDISDTKVWKVPYSYIANNYWNLDFAVNEPSDRELHGRTWGYNQASMLGMDLWPYWPGLPKAFGWDGVFNKSVQKVPGLNTHGYWWRVYKDFWVIGVILMPLFGGFWQGWIYNRVRLYPHLPYLYVYSFASVFIVMTFFGDFWALFSTPIYLLVLWGIGKNCTLTGVHS